MTRFLSVLILFALTASVSAQDPGTGDNGGMTPPVPPCEVVSGDVAYSLVDDMSIDGTFSGDLDGALTATVDTTETFGSPMSIISFEKRTFSGTIADVDGDLNVTGSVTNISFNLSNLPISIPFMLPSIRRLRTQVNGGTLAYDGQIGFLRGLTISLPNGSGFSNYHGLICDDVPDADDMPDLPDNGSAPVSASGN